MKYKKNKDKKILNESEISPRIKKKKIKRKTKLDHKCLKRCLIFYKNLKDISKKLNIYVAQYSNKKITLNIDINLEIKIVNKLSEEIILVLPKSNIINTTENIEKLKKKEKCVEITVHLYKKLKNHTKKWEEYEKKFSDRKALLSININFYICTEKCAKKRTISNIILEKNMNKFMIQKP